MTLTRTNRYVLHKFKGATAQQQQQMITVLREQMNNLSELMLEMEKAKK